MPRSKRKQSSTGIYHVILRGINRQPFFEEPTDCRMFLKCLEEVKKISGFTLYAYCLMGNHVHLLMKENKEPLAQIFKRIGDRYVFWFNWKYERSGHLFQDRFRSEPVESDEYFTRALLYIYQNPVKAGLCKRTEDYEWSSRRLLCTSSMIDEDELMEIAPVETIKEREHEEAECDFLEPVIGRRMTVADEEVLAQMKGLSGTGSVAEFQLLDRARQSIVFKKLRGQGASIRQMARVSGLGKGVVEYFFRRYKTQEPSPFVL